MIASATPETVSRLLALYPLGSLRENWPKQGKTKNDICNWVARNVGPSDIYKFLDEYLGCCKQHVHVFSHENKIDGLPRFRISDAEKILDKVEKATRRLLYIAKVDFRVILTDPPREETLSFLWPVRLDFTQKHLIARFVILEKDVRSYFGDTDNDSRVVRLGKSLTEKDVLAHLGEALTTFEVLDVHRGIKKLWDTDRIDGLRVSYIKPLSTSSETMKPGKGIKENYPDLYKILTTSSLLSSFFMVAKSEESSVSTFSANPALGFLAFGSYSEHIGDTDYLVSEIIRNN